MNTTAETRLLSVREVALRYRVQPQTIIQLIRAKKFKAFQIGHLWRVDADSLQQYIDSTTIHPTAE